MRSTPPRRDAPLRFAPIEEWGDRAALRAPLFASGRGTSRKFRPRLRRGSNKEEWRASQQESSKQGTPPSGTRSQRNGRLPAPREAEEPMPQRSLNPTPRPPRRLANPTPAGVPILVPTRFANPSPVTSASPSPGYWRGSATVIMCLCVGIQRNDDRARVLVRRPHGPSFPTR